MIKSKVTAGITMSLDGFTAGVHQSFENPFGDNFSPNLLERWMFEEPEKRNHKKEIDAILDAGAFILGSNMYGPKDRRETSAWKGWWGDNPPYHAPVFILTHQKREPIVMQGGTTFTFVTEGIHAALAQAKAASGNRDVKIMGGANTLNQYLAAGLVDELWLHIVPVTVGAGTRLFEKVPPLRLEALEVSGTSVVTHIRYKVLH